MPGQADVARVAAELTPPVRPVDLTSPTAVHIIGIGGAGMRAIARVLLAMGHEVSGSDRADSAHLQALAALGATVHVGHDGANVKNALVVTRSTAVPDDNPEVFAALALDVPVLARAEVLAAISKARPAILVAGTHGKTTTSSMLAVLLDAAGTDPSFVIGSDLNEFGSGARWATGVHSVIEADESDGTFLALDGAHAIVTSLDPDHLDYYGSRERLHDAFVAFVGGIQGTTVVCADDPDTTVLRDLDGVVTYGESADADVRITNVVVDRGTTRFDVLVAQEPLGQVTIEMAGHHNALNATAALALALSLGIDFETAAAGLARFTGVARRFERRGEIAGITFIDDYAHLPAEIEAAIGAATAGGWDRVVVAYQPHRYTRTKALGASFGASFQQADALVLTDIYSAGEAPIPGVSGRIVYDSVLAASPDLAVTWQQDLDGVVDHLVSTLRRGDLCLTVGAGDLTSVPDRVIARLENHPFDGDAFAEVIAERIDGSGLHRDAPLGSRTTYRVGGSAAILIEATTIDDVRYIAAAARECNAPLIVIGRGSNLLVADRGFAGVVIALDGLDEIVTNGLTITAGAAASLPLVARHSVASGLNGFEWAVGVPGSIGGAVTMNAGGHGSDIAASLISATVIDMTSGALETWDSARFHFGYRQSSIGSDHCVIDATFKLAPGDVTEGETVLRDIVRWRRENQPGGQNAGSVFTNPPGDSAGRLIDAAGLKGRRIGSAEVSEKHANFVQVDAGGSADDVFELMHVVADTVVARFGIELEPETRLVGFGAFRQFVAGEKS